MNRLFGTICIMWISLGLIQAQSMSDAALQVHLEKFVQEHVITKDTVLYGESLVGLTSVIHDFLNQKGYADYENFSYSYELSLGGKTISSRSSDTLSQEESMEFTAYLSNTDFQEEDVKSLLSELQQGEEFAKKENIKETHTYNFIRKDTLGTTRGGELQAHILDLNTLSPERRKALLTALKDERVRKAFQENGIVVKGMPE